MSSRFASPDGSRWVPAVAACVLASAAVVAVAAGTGGSPTLPDDDHDATRLVIEGSSNDTAHYWIAVDGSLEPAGSSADVEVGEGGDERVAGTVNGSDADAYRVSGAVTGLAVAGNATLVHDGHEVDPATLSDGWAVAFDDCSTVTVSGQFARGYAFSTVVFPVREPGGDLVGYERHEVNERFDAANRTATLRAGTTLPENVSEVAALRSVFLYERPVEGDVDPLLVESEVVARIGEPPVRVGNPAYGACREAVEDRLVNGTGTAAVADLAATGRRP